MNTQFIVIVKLLLCCCCYYCCDAKNKSKSTKKRIRSSFFAYHPLTITNHLGSKKKKWNEKNLDFLFIRLRIIGIIRVVERENKNSSSNDRFVIFFLLFSFMINSRKFVMMNIPTLFVWIKTISVFNNHHS